MQSKYVVHITYILMLVSGVAIYLLILFMINNKQNTSLNTMHSKQINSIQMENEFVNKNKVIDSTINDNIIKEDHTNNELVNENIVNNYLTYTINVSVANVRESPSTSAKIISRYKINDEVVVIRKINKWAELKDGGFIHIDLLTIKP